MFINQNYSVKNADLWSGSMAEYTMCIFYYIKKGMKIILVLNIMNSEKNKELQNFGQFLQRISHF